VLGGRACGRVVSTLNVFSVDKYEDPFRINLNRNFGVNFQYYFSSSFKQINSNTKEIKRNVS
jgi:hypothetical protein